MRYELFDFQEDASNKLLDKIVKMQKHWHEDKELSSVALTAPTGAGKTVICASIVESLFNGNTRVGEDRNAVVLWLSDNPSLNKQTKHRFAVAADNLNEDVDMVEIGADFAKSHSKLERRKVYFLNRQKLSASGILGNPSEGGRTFWDVLTETINDENLNLYLMIDEAHKGLGNTADDRRTSDSMNKTIYSKLIDGQKGINPPMPVVIGISATPQRWKEAMGSRDDRNEVAAVKVPTDKVREAGIIKEVIELRSPKDSFNAKQQDLILACKKLAQITDHWKTYHDNNGDRLVIPLLVVQVEDKISNDSLLEICKIIHEVLPDLDTKSCFANVFGEHEDFGNDAFMIPYKEPDKIQELTEIRVLFAKDAISTGWDCPRAEVLYSRRKRTDKTYIQQMLGRMIRTPLAKKIQSDDFLNSVMCYLPEYDEKSVNEVAELIKNDSDMGKTTNTVVNPVETGWFSGIKQTAEAAVTAAESDDNDGYIEVESGVRTAITQDIPLVDGLENISVTPDSQDDLFDDQTPVAENGSDTPSELAVTQEDKPVQADGVGSSVAVPDGKDENKSTLTEIRVKPPVTPPKKPPKKPKRVNIDKPKVQTAIGNMPTTSNAEEDKLVKESFEGIITRHVENKRVEKFRVLFNCINLLTSVTDPEGNTWESDESLKTEFCNQIEAAITAHPQDFKRDLREATTRKQTVLKLDALTGDKIEVLADESVEIFQIKLAGFEENKFFDEACRKFCNRDYVKGYFDYKKAEIEEKKQNGEMADVTDIDTYVNNRLYGVINCITVFTDLELWAERKTKELIDKHDGNKGRLNDDERKEWDEIVGNTHSWVEKHLKAPEKSNNQSYNFPKFKKHVIHSKDGYAYLNITGEMEMNVLNKEIADAYNIAWYRNEARNLNSSLCIPYMRTQDGYENFYPDFIFFEKTNDGKINRNIIDPHGIQYDDYLPRLKGYIEYLKDHGDDFSKVLAIANLSSTEYRSLDLKDAAVVKAIEQYSGDTVKDLFISKVSKLYWKKQ